LKRFEVRIVGYGGQGVITLSKMIAYATGICENLLVTQTEAYGAQARGGRSYAEVVVDLDRNSKLIDYPKALKPYDILIILSQAAAQKVDKGDIKEETNTGYLIWDSSTIEKFRVAKNIKNISLPIQKLALEQFGNMVYGSSILFGVFTHISKIFSEESAIETIKQFVPSSTLDINLKAFKLGIQKAKVILDQLKEGAN
jgi:2-oxoglutarate ferredoxin oxidoreductase subunit gamma